MRAPLRSVLFVATAVLLAGCNQPSTTSVATPAASSTSAQAPAAATDPATLAHRAIERRATEAALWGIAAVNYDLMLQQMLTRTPGKVNQVIYWGKPLDWHNQTLTPNPDTLYFITFYDTKDVGPIVLDIPARGANGESLNANIVNLWQEPLEDAGALGIDKGAGIRFVILPPGYKDKVPAGYTPLTPNTYGGYALIRSKLDSHGDADVARSVAYGKLVKVYPLSQANAPPATVFSDVGAVDYDSTIRYDASFFDNLNRIVQRQPWRDRDRAMIDSLRTLGIEKGKPFAPDAATRDLLARGVQEAGRELEARYDAGLPAFYPGTHWTAPAPAELVQAAATGFSDPDRYPVDARALAYSYAYVGIKRLGTGQFYLLQIKDKEGKSFEGAKTYRLHVPANVPVDQYWSVTAYDRRTHALIKNMARASRASNAADVAKNADGSVYLYFGPKAPSGKDANWVPTDPARGFELMFRAYGPQKAFFEKQWALTDAEVVQ